MLDRQHKAALSVFGVITMCSWALPAVAAGRPPLPDRVDIIRRAEIDLRALGHEDPVARNADVVIHRHAPVASHPLAATAIDHSALPVVDFPSDPENHALALKRFAALVPADPSYSTDLHRVLGGDYVVTVVGSQVYVERTSGDRLAAFSLPALWNEVSRGAPLCELADVALVYDSADGRWALAMVADGGLPTASLVIAVSATSDPSSTWRAYQLRPAGNGGVWADAPRISFGAGDVLVEVELQPLRSGASCGAPAEDLAPGQNRLYTFSKDSFAQPTVHSVQEANSPSNLPPSSPVVSPSTGSGGAAVFTFSYSDPNGFSDLSAVHALFNTVIFGGNACFITYFPGTNQFGLLNDAGTTYVATFSPGANAFPENSQCLLYGPGTSVAGSGGVLSLSVTVVFKFAFAGTKAIYMNATDISGLSTGWVVRGAWSIPASNLPPSPTFVSPSSGTATSQRFTFEYNDPNGAGDIAEAYGLIHNALNGAGACFISYLRGSPSLVALINDAGTAAAGFVQPGTSQTATNSQCTISSVEVTTSGSLLRVSVTVSFKPAFAGPRNIYMNALDTARLSAGWAQKGSWTIPSGGIAPTAGVSPNTGAGTAQAFDFIITDPNGAADVSLVHMLFNTVLNGQNACYVTFEVFTGQLRLLNDQGNAYSNVTPGIPTTAENSRCILNGTGSSVAGSGTSLFVRINLIFKPLFAGVANIYVYPLDYSGLTPGWLAVGTWGIPSSTTTVPPFNTLLAPSASVGAAQTFTVAFTDITGASNITFAGLLFNSVLNGAGGCFVGFQPQLNQIVLMNDAGTAPIGGIAPGSSATIQNSQCRLRGTGSSMAIAGTTFTASAQIEQFFPAFAGTKNIYTYVSNTAGLTSGWEIKGTWIVP